MTKVKKMSRFFGVMDGIITFVRELWASEEASNDAHLESLVGKIREHEDSAKISDLEAKTTSCNISLKDEIVPKAKVSEKDAQKAAKGKVTEKDQKIRE